MPVFEVIKSYRNGLVLNEEMLDDVKNSVESFFNDGEIDADNLQDGCITTALLASSSVDSDELDTGAVIASTIEDAAVTVAKLASGGTAIYSGSAVTTTVGTRASDIDDTTVRSAASITTSGGTVMIKLQASSSSTPAWLGVDNSHALDGPNTFDNCSGFTLFVAFCRDNVNIAVQKVTMVNPTSSGSICRFSPSSFSFIDAPAAGTYSYGFRVAMTPWYEDPFDAGTMIEAAEGDFLETSNDDWKTEYKLEVEIENVMVSVYEL